MSAENESTKRTKTAFSLLKSFPNPMIESQLESVELLQACSEAVKLFEKFGKAFASLIADMKKNIETLEDMYSQNTVEHKYVEKMVRGERNQAGISGRAKVALLWLARDLHFFGLFFKYATSNEIENDKPEQVSMLFRKAYAEALEFHHGWLGTQLVQLLIDDVPGNNQFFKIFTLGDSYKKEQVLHDMRQYNQGLLACVSILKSFYEE